MRGVKGQEGKLSLVEAGQPVFSLKFIKGVKYVHVILLKQTKKNINIT